MTTLINFLISVVMSLFLLSCNFNYQINTGKKGNGKVQSEERIKDQNFNSIKASNGLQVYLTQSTNNLVKVQADENIINLIKTEIKDQTLHIYTSENVGKCGAKKVLINFTNLNQITTTSGVDLVGTNNITTQQLHIKSSSGSQASIQTNSEQITCDSSSGATIKITGSTNSLSAEASSGSAIQAKKLISKNCFTDASSGASITVHCDESITAESSSGSSINYLGEPQSVQKEKSSGGSISSY